MSVWVGLYRGADHGDYRVEVIARPEGEADPGDLPYRSAALSTSGPLADADLLIELVEAAPNGVPAAEALSHGQVLLLYAYHPRDLDEMLAFDTRVNAAYLAFHDARGEHYAGVFHPRGLPGEGWLAELSAFRAGTREEAEALIPADSLTPEISDIVAECRARQDTTRARYGLWLTPHAQR